MSELSLKYLLFGEDKTASKAIKGVGDEAGRTGGKLKEFGAGLAGGLAGAAVSDAAHAAIDAASDLNETVSKSQVIFGKNAAAIDAWASTASTKLGLSKQAALEAASGFGDMFHQLGFTANASQKMSTQVVQMATDLGSFNNLPTAEVTDMLSGAFRGEYDSLQRLIPNISAARVATEAQRLGLVKSTVDVHKVAQARQAQGLAEERYQAVVKKFGANSSEARSAELALSKAKDSTAKAAAGVAGQLSSQAQAQAVLSIVQHDGARANGDFARTSSGVANQTKIQKAELENLQATIGAKLIPVQQKLLEVGMKVIDWVSKNLDLIGPLAGVIGAVVAATWLWNAALSANPIGLVVIGLAALAAGLIYAYQHSETFRHVVDTAFHAIATAAQWMWNNALKPVISFMLAGFQGVVTWVGNLLRALSHIPGFGWAKDAADKLDAAANAAAWLTAKINAVPTSKTITVRMKTITDAGAGAGAAALLKGSGLSGFASGGRNIPAQWAIVGEHGPELMRVPGGADIYSTGETAQMLAGAGPRAVATASAAGSDQVLNVITMLDGNVVHQSLRRVKRRTGADLGLA